MDIKTAPSTDSMEQKEQIYDLGNCIFYAGHGEICSKISDKSIHLERKVSQVLTCLVQAKGKVVTREEIFDTVWPNHLVSDDSLNRCISVLRKKLKVFDHSITIKTHPKIGFNINYKNTNGLEQGLLFEPQNNTLFNYSFIPKSLAIKTIVISIVLFITWIYFNNTLHPYKAIPEVNSIALNERRLVIVPFELPTELQNKYQNVEYIYRQLMTNHPRHYSVSASELNDIKYSPARDIGTQFNARFIVMGKVFNEDKRDILRWQIIDAQTGDEVLNESLNLAINTNEINARILAADFIATTVQICFDNDVNGQMQYIVDSANYLFTPNNSQTYHRPVINLLAQAVTYIDPDNISALKTLAKLLSTMIGPSVTQNTTYLNLAIESLNKAIDLAPYQAELYEQLAYVYMLKYQWQDAHLILFSGNATLNLKPEFKQVSNLKLMQYVGYFDGLYSENIEKSFDSQPLDNNSALLLIDLYLKQNQFKKAFAIANNLNIKNDQWGQVGANIGPLYIKQGEFEKGISLTQAGYQYLGMKIDDINILIKGISNQDYAPQASQILTEKANANEIPETVMLNVYAELNDVVSYFKLADKLSDSYQFQLFSSMGTINESILSHEKFQPLMDKIGMTLYWKQHGLPSFCNYSASKVCL